MNQIRFPLNRKVSRHVGVVTFFLSLAVTVPQVQSEPIPDSLTSQERFVRDQVSQEKCVTFSKDTTSFEKNQQDLCRGRAVSAIQFAPQLRAEFIQNLLMGHFNKDKSARFVVIDGAVFHGRLNLRNFDLPMEVRLTNGRFDDSLDFSTSHFRAPLNLSGSRFTESNLNFNSMKVTGGLVLNDLQVPGGIEFYHLDVDGDVFIERSSFTNSNKSLEFGESDIKGDMFVVDTRIEGSLSMVQSSLRGLNLRNVKIGKKLDLSHAHIDRVFDLGLVNLPNPPNLAGLVYGDLSEGGVDKRLRTLIDEESKTNYIAQSYSQLEDYYKQHGLPQEADDVYIESKRIERKRLSRIQRAYSWLLDRLVGYGRHPENALYLSLGVVLFGTMVFWRRRGMELQDLESTRTIYNPFWYSLDLLTPIIDMDAARVWMPRESWRFGRNYARVHRILGWILVPIGLAAITGIIK
jgi:hypothetical protein